MRRTNWLIGSSGGGAGASASGRFALLLIAADVTPGGLTHALAMPSSVKANGTKALLVRVVHRVLRRAVPCFIGLPNALRNARVGRARRMRKQAA
jgi:hypothetical protein